MPLANTMLHKTIQIMLINPHMAMTNDQQYYAHPLEIDIMKYLVSKGHVSYLTGGLYLVNDNNDCTLAFYFDNDGNFKNYCSISATNISTNTVIQISLNYCLMAIIKN